MREKELEIIYSLGLEHRINLNQTVIEMRLQRFEIQYGVLQVCPSVGEKLNKRQISEIELAVRNGIPYERVAISNFSPERIQLIHSRFLEGQDCSYLLNWKYDDSLAFLLTNKDTPEIIRNINNIHEFSEDQIYMLFDAVEEGLPLETLLNPELSPREMDKEIQRLTPKPAIQKMNIT